VTVVQDITLNNRQGFQPGTRMDTNAESRSALARLAEEQRR
jgi:hypothetical protein